MNTNGYKFLFATQTGITIRVDSCQFVVQKEIL